MNILEIILLILIGLKLNMMNGLYLALIIFEIILCSIRLICLIVNLILKIKGD